MLDSLRHWLLIVEHGTFAEAARHAHLSQPALTASIQRLEAELGAPLLVRTHKGSAPTAAGTALLPHARACLSAWEGGHRAVAEIAGLRAGELRLAGGPTAVTWLLPGPLAAFQEDHPRIRYRLVECDTPALVDGLLEGRFDLGIGTAADGIPLDLPPGIEVAPWLEDELVVVCAPEMEGRGRPFVTFPRGASIQALLDAHFPEAEIVMELGSIAAILGHVRAGMGVALTSRLAVEEGLAAGRLRRVADPRLPLRRRFLVLDRGAARRSPAVEAFRARLLGKVER